MKSVRLFFLLMALFAASAAIAQVPRLISHQGLLTDSTGNALRDTALNITMSLFSVPTGGSSLYTQTFASESVKVGVFSVIMGPVNLPFDQQYWLELKTGTDTHAPRLQLTSAAYAMRADTAEYVKHAPPSTSGGWTDVGTVVRLTTSGDSVGIGTLSPTKKLEVSGSAKITDTLFASNVSSNSPLRLETAGTTRMFLDDVTGNVGVGMTSPRTKLDVFGSVNALTTFGFTLGTTLLNPNGDGGMYHVPGVPSGYLWVYSNIGGMRLGTQHATNAVMIDTNGNVGIGTTTPSSKLEVAGSNGDLLRLSPGTGLVSDFAYINFNNNRAKFGYDPSGGVIVSDGGSFHSISLQNDNLTRLYISTGTGNVGIGTTSPSYDLEINDVSDGGLNLGLYRPDNSLNFGSVEDFLLKNSSGAKTLYARISGSISSNTAGSENGFISFQVRTNGTLDNLYSQEKMRITSTGNVGIGTTAPTEKLDVAAGSLLVRSSATAVPTFISSGGIEAQSQSTLETIAMGLHNKDAQDGTGAVSLAFGLSAGSGITAKIMNTRENSSAFRLGFFTFKNSLTERMTIASTGEVGIGTTTPRAQLDVVGTGAMIVPIGTTAQRPGPATAVQGMIRFNTDTNKFEGYDGTAWQDLN
jgi:hypothetical protein